MTFTRADWREIKRETLIFMGILLIATVAVAVCWHWYQAADKSLTAAQARRLSSQNTFSNVEQERAELLASLAPYQELVNRSIIGEEQRLKWRETLATEQVKAGIEKLSYSLSIRQPWTTDTGDAVGEQLFKRHRSTMIIKTEFRRETGFVDFLENVSRNAHAIVIVRACEITRARDSAQTDNEQLKAECLIDWATLQRATSDEGGNGS